MEMRSAVMDHYKRATIIIKAAAVADFRCRTESCQKIKKKGGAACMTLDLEKNPDIISELGEIKGDRVLVGFAAETENMLAHAQDKLKRKNLDLIVANDVSKEGIGFGSDMNEVAIIDRSGNVRQVPMLTKDEIAHIILDAVKKVLKKRKKVEEDWL